MLFKIDRISPTHLKIATPAKINLFLEILSKRPDGYHNLNSLFQAIDLYDQLEFELTDRLGIMIELTDNVSVPTDSSNLIWKAWDAAMAQAGQQQGVKIRLTKKIPIAAGLAGGSSDAAATIMAANELLGLDWDAAKMAEIGLMIGSDLPFFFSGGQAIVTGRGENVSAVSFPTDYHLVLVSPDLTISTAEAYRSLTIDLTKSKQPFSLSPCSTVMEFVDQVSYSVNDFEKAHFLSYSVLDRIKNGLLQIGASLVRMSGSGPTIFGLFIAPPNLKSGIPNEEGSWRIITAHPVVVVNNA